MQTLEPYAWFEGSGLDVRVGGGGLHFSDTSKCTRLLALYNLPHTLRRRRPWACNRLREISKVYHGNLLNHQCHLHLFRPNPICHGLTYQINKKTLQDGGKCLWNVDVNHIRFPKVVVLYCEVIGCGGPASWGHLWHWLVRARRFCSGPIIIIHFTWVHISR